MSKPIKKNIKNSNIRQSDKIKANQQEMLNEFNIKINKALKKFNRSSETTRTTSFNEWLGGMMDSDGNFYLDKNNYLRCRITVSSWEISSLMKIKKRFGGRVYKMKDVKACSWVLSQKLLVKDFLNAVNGNIYLKVNTYTKVMKIYNPGTKIIINDFSNSGGWLSGFFEGEGHIYLGKADYALRICISQKIRPILEKIKNIYGGFIYEDNQWNTFIWEVADKDNLIKIFEYFTLYPLMSVKNSEVFSAKKFFRFKLQGYHSNPAKQKLLDRFIINFQNRKKI